MSKQKPKGPQPFHILTETINAQWIEQNRDFGVPTNTDLSVTGERYATLTTTTLYIDRDMALVGGLGTFDSYARNRPTGNLYWHTMPTIERVRTEDGPAYRVEMKLLISDNPIVPRLAAEALHSVDAADYKDVAQDIAGRYPRVFAQLSKA